MTTTQRLLDLTMLTQAESAASTAGGIVSGARYSFFASSPSMARTIRHAKGSPGLSPVARFEPPPGRRFGLGFGVAEELSALCEDAAAGGGRSAAVKAAG